MDRTFLFILLSGLALIYLVLGKYTGQNTQTEEDFYLSGRKVQLIPLVFTILATQIGGASMIGAAQEAYFRGWYGFLYSMGVCAGLILLAVGVGARLRRLNVMTLPHVFEVIYQSTRLRWIAAVFSIISLFLILVGQGVAARLFFASAGFQTDLFFVVFWLVVVVYTTLGGLNAVIYTDLVQAGVVMMALITVAFFSLYDHTETLLALPSSGVMEFHEAELSWTHWVLMPMLFMIIGQDMGQRCCAASSPRTVSIAMMLAAFLYMIFTSIPVLLGLLARAESVPILPEHSVLMSAIMHFTNPYIAAFCGAALLMAIISTADSLLCAVSANLALDIPWVRKECHLIKFKTALGLPKLITLSLGLIAMFATFLSHHIIPLLIYAYELSIDVLFVPIFLGVLLTNPHKLVAIVAMIIGGLGFIVTNVYPMGLWDKVLWLMTSASISLLIHYVVNRWEIKPK